MNIAYEEFVEFLAGGSTPRELIEFQPSEKTRAKVSELIRRQNSASLSPDESSELNCYLQLEHIMRLAKARARLRLAGQ